MGVFPFLSHRVLKCTRWGAVPMGKIFAGVSAIAYVRADLSADGVRIVQAYLPVDGGPLVGWAPVPTSLVPGGRFEVQGGLFDA